MITTFNEEALIAYIACQDMGFFPQATIDENNVRHKRTEWQDGWNAACQAILKKQVKLDIWFKNIGDDLKTIIFELVDESLLYFRITDTIQMWLIMNDTFYFACADGEDVEIDELKEVYCMWKQFSYDGLIAWVSCKRNQEPLEQLQTESYQNAMKHLVNKRNTDGTG